MGWDDLCKMTSCKRVIDVNSERLVYILSFLVGREVDVHVKNNSRFRGFFYSCLPRSESDTGDFKIILRYARELPYEKKLSGEIFPILIIPGDQFTSLKVEHVPFECDDINDCEETVGNKKSGIMKLDSEISNKKMMGLERGFQRWVDGGDSCSMKDLNVALDDLSASRGWDQFESNKRYFGVTTTYEDDLYTTKLDVNAIPTAIKDEADRIAREIESQPSCGFSDPDLMLDDDCCQKTEEALFSAVNSAPGTQLKCSSSFRRRAITQSNSIGTEIGRIYLNKRKQGKIKDTDVPTRTHRNPSFDENDSKNHPQTQFCAWTSHKKKYYDSNMKRNHGFDGFKKNGVSDYQDNEDIMSKKCYVKKNSGSIMNSQDDDSAEIHPKILDSSQGSFEISQLSNYECNSMTFTQLSNDLL